MPVKEIIIVERVAYKSRTATSLPKLSVPNRKPEPCSKKAGGRNLLPKSVAAKSTGTITGANSADATMITNVIIRKRMPGGILHFFLNKLFLLMCILSYAQFPLIRGSSNP